MRCTGCAWRSTRPLQTIHSFPALNMRFSSIAWNCSCRPVNENYYTKIRSWRKPRAFKKVFPKWQGTFACPVTKTVNEMKPHYLHNTYRDYSLFNEEEKLRSRLEEELELKDVHSAIFLRVLKRVRKSPFIGCWNQLRQTSSPLIWRETTCWGRKSSFF